MKKYIVELTSEERKTLTEIIQAERMAAHKRRHARILLKADQGPEGPGWKDADIANAFDCTIKSIERFRKRLVECGLDAAMEDVLELYQRPYDPQQPLICLDEASKQLVAETRESIAVEPGKPKRVDAEYRRCGTASVFMMTAPLEGKRYVRVRRQRKRVDFAEVIRELCDEVYPDADKIVLVMDNLNTHNTASLYEAFEPCEAWRLAQKLEIHHTPKHGSWLNMAEIELSILSRQCMDDYFESADELTTGIAAWEGSRNEKKTGIHWRFTTDDARIKLRKLYPTI